MRRPVRRATGTSSISTAVTIESSAPRCSLVYSDKHSGTFDAIWSTSPVAGALATLKPAREVPSHYFKTNLGVRELCKAVASPSGKAQRLAYRGWTAFMKMAKSHDARFNFVESRNTADDARDSEPVAIFLNCAGVVSRVHPGESFSFESVHVAAAVPEAHAEALSLKQDSPCFFQQKVDKMGASVALKNIDEFTTEKGTDAAQQRVADGGDVELPSPVMSRLKRSDSGRFF